MPPEDCVATEPRPAQVDIEALMMTRDPERPAEMRFDEDVRRNVNTRRRKYPGNSRFRRDPRGGAGVESERRRDEAVEWHGPWRRASDQPPVQADPPAVDLPPPSTSG